MLSFITLTNEGYLEYTRNMIKSLELCECDVPLKVYCIGQDCYDMLDYKNKVLLDVDAPSEKQVFREGDWNKMMAAKMSAIKCELDKGNDVLFSDGDIVWLNKRFIQDIKNRTDDNDLLFQNDHQDDNDYGQVCCGLIWAKSCDNNKRLFDVSQIDMERFKCDQIYMNEIKDELNYEMLPLKKYPNGKYWCDRNPDRKNCIHFNYLIGDQKEEIMRSSGYWYV